MKSLLILIAALPILPLAATAQIAAPPVAPAATPIPASKPAVSGSANATTSGAASAVPLPGQPAGPSLEKNIPLIPDTAPGSRGGGHSGHAHAGASPSEPVTFKTEDDIRMRIRIRIAETHAQNDPAIQADWVAAHHTHTDVEHRTLLTAYYNHLYDKMIKMDPGIAQRANIRRGATIARMKYTRLGEVDNSEDPFVPAPPVVSGPNPPPAPDNSTNNTQ